MNVTAIASAATEMAQTRTGEAVSLLVLKKALNLQAEGAVQLIQAAAQSAPSASGPAHLGSNIDIFA